MRCLLHCISACCSSVSKVDSFEIRLPGLLKTSSAVLHVLYPPIRAHHEYAVQSAEKFMADLLAIVASTQDSEDQQIAAAKKLSTAYAADLRAWMGRWVGKVRLVSMIWKHGSSENSKANRIKLVKGPKNLFDASRKK